MPIVEPITDSWVKHQRLDAVAPGGLADGDVESAAAAIAALRPAIAADVVSALHPADGADVLEELEPHERAEVVEELDPKIGAEVLIELDESERAIIRDWLIAAQK